MTIGGSYVRQALKDGVAMQGAEGYNPYKIGVVGGSDSHNTGVPYRQDNFFGGHARLDGAIKERMAGHNFAGLDVRFENPAGLTGIWAEENTRESLFDAMQRKETFATSGPRMTLRFFGGWDYQRRHDRVRRTGCRPPTPAACRWAATCQPRSASAGADLRGLGGEGSDLGQSRPHPDRQGLGQGRPDRSRRSTTSSGPASASPIRSTGKVPAIG